MADSPQNAPKKVELPETHPLKIKEASLLQRQKELNAMDERAQGRAGHDLRAAKQRNENDIDAIRAEIAKENK